MVNVFIYCVYLMSSNNLIGDLRFPFHDSNFVDNKMYIYLQTNTIF